VVPFADGEVSVAEVLMCRWSAVYDVVAKLIDVVPVTRVWLRCLWVGYG
jgi:hypothetical protein